MTASIGLNFPKSLTIERDPDGPIKMVLSTEEGDVVSYCGQHDDDAARLLDMIQKAAMQISHIIATWEELPDEFDGFIFQDRGSWYVKLEGAERGTASGATAYPSRDVAIVELAQAMVDTGSFPNVWSNSDDWGSVSIDDEVRAHHDDGGTAMLPVETRYEPHQDVEIKVSVQTGPMTWVDEWVTAEVVKDYGERVGVWCAVAYDDEYVVRYDAIRPVEEEEEDDQ